MSKHGLSVGHLSIMEGDAQRRRGQPPGALPLALTPVTLEAEGMVPVGTDRASVAETGLPFVAGLAGVTYALRFVGSSERHVNPQQSSCQAPVTAQVIRWMFASTPPVA
jgi:hypothetical protein